MFKKLSNLLFEEEEIEDEVNLDESDPIQVEPSNIRKVKRPIEQEPMHAEPKPAMQRIDVQPNRVEPNVAMSNTQESVFARPTTLPQASPKPIAKEPVQPEKPKSLGITVDEITPASVKPAQVQKKPAKPAARREEPRSTASVYEFRPVISPMFGVDEKDMDAVQTTAKMIKSSENDGSMSKIISPIYGQSVEAQPTKIQPTVEKSNEVEDLTVHEESLKAEDDIPAFSLDDILNARDEEYKRENDVEDDMDFEDAEMMDETVVLDPFGADLKKDAE